MIIKIHRCFFLILLILIVQGYPYLLSAKSPESKSDQDPESKYISYKIGTSDVLTITVYDSPDLSGDFVVSGEGNIVYPLVGQIKVSGLNIIEIKKMLTDMLEKDYLYNPIVSVTIKEYKSKQVHILGNVGKPGIYYLNRPTRLFDMLSMAQGISSEPGKILKGQKARIVRQEGNSSDPEAPGKMKTIFIDLYDLIVEGKEDANIILKEGDTIYIPEIQKIHVVGGVKKPGTFPYEEGITVLKAITIAGGTEERASTENTVIKRITGGKEIKVKATMSDILYPEDIIEITTEIPKIHVIGEVNKPGSFSYEEGITVLKAITLAGGPTKKAAVKNTIIKRIKDGKEEKVDVEMTTILQSDDIVEVPLSFW